MSQERPASIEAHGLVREFKKGPRAVDGIDLEVAPGEIYGFLGPNGAGKSTTVLMLTTLLPPTAGTATVAGYDVVREGPQVRRSIGAALQEAALDPFLTGREHMRLQTAMHGLAPAERRVRGDELLERVGLMDAADRKVGGYSGGMRRSSTWRWRWSTSRRSCSSTSPPPGSTSRAARRCVDHPSQPNFGDMSWNKLMRQLARLHDRIAQPGGELIREPGFG